MLSIFLQWDKEPSDVSQVIPEAQPPNPKPEPRALNTSTLNPNLKKMTQQHSNTARHTRPYLLMFSVCSLIYARLRAPTGTRRRVEGHEGKVRRHRVLLRRDLIHACLAIAGTGVSRHLHDRMRRREGTIALQGRADMLN